MDELVRAEFDRMSDENIRQNHRIETLESKVEQLGDIMLAIKELSINMGHMVQRQDEMKNDLDEIKSKPAENWNKAVWAIISVVIGIAVGYLFHSVGIE